MRKCLQARGEILEDQRGAGDRDRGDEKERGEVAESKEAKFGKKRRSGARGRKEMREEVSR